MYITDNNWSIIGYVQSQFNKSYVFVRNENIGHINLFHIIPYIAI